MALAMCAAACSNASRCMAIRSWSTSCPGWGNRPVTVPGQRAPGEARSRGSGMGTLPSSCGPRRPAPPRTAAPLGSPQGFQRHVPAVDKVRALLVRSRGGYSPAELGAQDSLSSEPARPSSVRAVRHRPSPLHQPAQRCTRVSEAWFVSRNASAAASSQSNGWNGKRGYGKRFEHALAHPGAGEPAQRHPGLCGGRAASAALLAMNALFGVGVVRTSC